MHLLLDTNIFIDFIKDGKDEPFVDSLDKLSEDGSLKLLVPDVLSAEWNNKRQQTLEYISKTFTTTAALSSSQNTKILLKDSYTLAKERAAFIDKLLGNGIKIKTTQKVKAEVVDRSIMHKAPFHDRKTKTINDALIYFTAISFLKSRKIKQFIFVTKDAGDFGAPENKYEILHKDLENPELETLYFTSLYKCLDKLKDQLIIKQKEEKEGAYQLIVVKKGNKSLLDHLYEVIKKYRSIITFLPSHFIARLEPFRIVHNIRYDYSYYSNLTLFTNNVAIVDFFNKVDIRKGRFRKGTGFPNSRKNIEKLHFILTALNENLVHKISYIAKHEEVDIKIETTNECSCAICKYRRLEFEDLLTQVYKEDDELKRAFILYQLGKFSDSLLVYFNVYQNAIREDNRVLSYRLLLTLHWVAQFAEYEVKESDKKSLIEKIKSIDRESLFLSALTGTKLEKEIALFFHGNTMIDHFRLIIKKHKEDINKHYQSQLKASYSSNSNLKNLIHDFLNFEIFTLYNGMAYTRYSDFEDICNDFIEAIFLSHSLNQYQSSRLEYLDDFFLEKMILYGKTDKIITYFNRYIKRQIAYSSEGKKIEKRILSFLNSSEETINYFSSLNYLEGNSAFYRIFWNIVLLISITKFDDNFVKSCVNKIFRFLEKIPKRESHQVHHLASLIHSKGKVFKDKVLSKIFWFIINNSNFHDEDILESFSSIEGYKFKVDIDEKGFELVSNMMLYKCPKCKEYHQNMLLYIFPILREEFQKQIKETVIEKLRGQFEKRLYYLSVIGDVIDYEMFFDQYLSYFIPPTNKTKSRSFFEGEILYRELNDLMNLVFKVKGELNPAFKKKLFGLSDYYDWLIDMKAFDYKKFKPVWIIQYPTKYYLYEAFSHEKVRTSVRSFLKFNNQPTLAFYYSQYVK